MSAVIETYSGGYFDYGGPESADVELVDIARALSNTCRFGGHVDGYLSVAEHALTVERLVAEAGFTVDVCFAALHHDSHEAYLGDVPTPLKRKLGEAWVLLQWKTDRAICEKLGIDIGLLTHDAVKAADHMALHMEAAKLKRSRGAGAHWGTDRPAHVPPWAVRCFKPYQVEALFLRRHHDLKEALGHA